MTAVKRTPQVSGDRLPLLITIGVFVGLLACLPLALMLDSATDGDRPMFHDMERMAGLQRVYVLTGEPPVETQLSRGESVMIGTKKFVVSDGVTLTVRATDEDDFCVSASNSEGARSERCSE
jgi:hypothetical protein